MELTQDMMDFCKIMNGLEKANGGFIISHNTRIREHRRKWLGKGTRIGLDRPLVNSLFLSMYCLPLRGRLLGYLYLRSAPAWCFLWYGLKTFFSFSTYIDVLTIVICIYYLKHSQVAYHQLLCCLIPPCAQFWKIVQS